MTMGRGTKILKFPLGKCNILAPFPKPFELRKRCEKHLLIQADIFMTQVHFCLGSARLLAKPCTSFLIRN